MSYIIYIISIHLAWILHPLQFSLLTYDQYEIKNLFEGHFLIPDNQSTQKKNVVA
jgi:hypothetical protein